MKSIDIQPRSEEIKIYSKGNQLIQQNPAANSAVNGVAKSAVNVVAKSAVNVGAKLSLKTIIIIIASVSVAVAATTATVIGVYATKSSKEDSKEEETTDNEAIILQIPINYTKEDFYSDRTKSYLDLINKLEQENAILYHWNLELDENNNAIFKNKYQYLYNYSTDLKPVNETIGYHLYRRDNYRMIDTDLKKYYNAINGAKDDHLIYGPSINGEEYAKNQSLYSDTIKLGK